MSRLWHLIERWRRRRYYFNQSDLLRIESTGELVDLDDEGGYRRAA